MDICLMDARNTVYRHGWTRQNLRNTEKKPTGAIFGFLSCLVRLRNFYPNAKFIMCWDGKDPGNSWRHQYSSSYKAHRKSTTGEELPIEVRNILSQIPAVKQVSEILGIPQFEVDSLEADDLIGILSKIFSDKKEVDNVYIYSMDKDMYQLIGGKVSVIRDLDKAKKCKPYKAKDVLKDHGVAPIDWIKYRALVGDPSDGIKSAFKKVGKVTALKILAAGLDPSKKEPTKPIEKKYSKEWSRCHKNYILSKIVIDANSKRLLEKNKVQLAELLKNIDFIPVVQDREDAAKQFIRFCSKYQLNWVMEQRFKFFKML